MNSQNVSAQLYNKQLPDVPVTYNCKADPTVPYLQTCVDDVSTDALIENAFQQQLDLSEYYKSPNIYNAMKKEFYDKTMPAQNTPILELPVTKTLPVQTSVGPVQPVGPRDFLQNLITTKESFGSTTNKGIYITLAVVCFLILFSYLWMKYKMKSL